MQVKDTSGVCPAGLEPSKGVRHEETEDVGEGGGGMKKKKFCTK